MSMPRFFPLFAAWGVALLITLFILIVRLVLKADPSEVGFTTSGMIGAYWIATTVGGLIVVALGRYRHVWWGAVAIGTLVAFAGYTVILLRADYAGIAFFREAAREGTMLPLIGLVLFAAGISGGGVGFALWWESRGDKSGSGI